MALDHRFADLKAELIAERLQVVGQPLRVKLVDRLAARASTVQELVATLQTTQQNVSQHLGILHRAGVVSRHKEGTHVRYELVDPHVLLMLELAQASLAHRLDELTLLIEPSHDSDADGSAR